MKILNSAIEDDARTKQSNFQRNVAVKDAAQQDYNNLVRQIGLAPANERYKAGMANAMAADAQMAGAKAKTIEAKQAAIGAASALSAKSDEYKANSLIKWKEAVKGTNKIFDPELGTWVDEKSYGEYAQKRALQGRENASQEAIAASKEGGKVSEGTQFISKQMQQAGFPALRQSVNTASELQQKHGDKGQGAFAQGLWARSPVVYNQIYGEGPAKREQAFQALANTDIKLNSGGAVSEGEWKRNVASLYGAKTKEARDSALDRLNENLTRGESNIYAGAGPEATAAYKSNVAALAPPKVDFNPSK
jgi:hypothetical protein